MSYLPRRSASTAFRTAAVVCVMAVALVSMLQASHMHRELFKPADTSVSAHTDDGFCVLCAGSWAAKPELDKAPLERLASARLAHLPHTLSSYSHQELLQHTIRPPPALG